MKHLQCFLLVQPDRPDNDFVKPISLISSQMVACPNDVCAYHVISRV